MRSISRVLLEREQAFNYQLCYLAPHVPCMMRWWSKLCMVNLCQDSIFWLIAKTTNCNSARWMVEPVASFFLLLKLRESRSFTSWLFSANATPCEQINLSRSFPRSQIQRFRHLTSAIREIKFAPMTQSHKLHFYLTQISSFTHDSLDRGCWLHMWRNHQRKWQKSESRHRAPCWSSQHMRELREEEKSYHEKEISHERSGALTSTDSVESTAMER